MDSVSVVVVVLMSLFSSSWLSRKQSEIIITTRRTYPCPPSRAAITFQPPVPSVSAIVYSICQSRPTYTGRHLLVRCLIEVPKCTASQTSGRQRSGLPSSGASLSANNCRFLSAQYRARNEMLFIVPLVVKKK